MFPIIAINCNNSVIFLMQEDSDNSWSDQHEFVCDLQKQTSMCDGIDSGGRLIKRNQLRIKALVSQE